MRSGEKLESCICRKGTQSLIKISLSMEKPGSIYQSYPMMHYAYPVMDMMHIQ